MTLSLYTRAGTTGSSTACVCHTETRTQGFSHARQARCPFSSILRPLLFVCPWEINGAPNFQTPRTTGQTCFIKIPLVPKAYGHSNMKVGHSVTLFFSEWKRSRDPSTFHVLLPPEDTRLTVQRAVVRGSNIFSSKTHHSQERWLLILLVAQLSFLNFVRKSKLHEALLSQGSTEAQSHPSQSRDFTCLG